MLTLKQWIDESTKQINKDLQYYKNVNDNKGHDWALGYLQALTDLKDFLKSRATGDTYWEEQYSDESFSE